MDQVNSQRTILRIVIGVAIVVAVLVALFRFKYYRTILIRDLSTTSTQTVSVAFYPHNVRWKISGNVQGTGMVVIPFIFSNSVSGRFSANGAGDYYDSNVSVIFMPQPKASGNLRASFFFENFP